MTDVDVCLSSAAIKNIILDQIQKDFIFVVGCQMYKCPRSIARLLSPRVGLAHSVDPSIAEYFVETSDLDEQFKLFMSFGSGSRIRVTKANLDFFICLSREFDNSNLYISLLKQFESDFMGSPIPDSTTLDFLSEDLIGRLSLNFSMLTRFELDAIPVSVLFHILSHHLLKISTEDELFSYISSRVCSDAEYLDLLRFVQFEYLSSKCVSDFVSSLPGSIDRRLWESLSGRLISAVRPVSPSKSLKGVEFPLKATKSLEGIISHLTQKHEGNVHNKGIVAITSKSVRYDDNSWYPAQIVADLTSGSYFLSKDDPGQWLCWDFHEMRLRPTHYTIKSACLKSWVVESSLDFVNWTEIDRRTDNEDFKSNHFVPASFTVSKLEDCRFIRLTQTGESHNGRDDLAVSAFEVFGALLELRM
jgi:hypothetical protein